MAVPEVSVVIPTRDRETRLAFALDGLKSQSLERHRFEVIVVRAPDSPPPLTLPPDGLDVTFTVSEAAGTAAQRNTGWRLAKAPLVVFSDDDCRASPPWLERILECSEDPDVIRHGRTEPDPEQTHHLWDIARTIEVGPDSPWFETCNIGYSRRMLERLDGFDEEFGFMGEDTDLGYRALAAGGRKVFVTDALVWHAVYTRNVPAAARDAIKRASVPRLVKRHPTIRDGLFLRTFTTPNHLFLLIGLIGFAVRRRHPVVGALAMAPYLRLRVNPTRLTSPWGIVRTLMTFSSKSTVDLLQVAAYAASSVRHRSLVL